MINKTENIREKLAKHFFIMLLLGFSLIFAGVMVVVVANVFSNGATGFGGIITIGPIPLIFGFGENAWLIVVVAGILTMVCLILFLLSRKWKQCET